MRTWADRLISKVYADLIFQVLEVNAKPMRCKEISQEISEHSDFPKLSPQYVRMQMNYMLHRGEIVRIEEHTPYSKRKTVYFAIPSAVAKEEEEWDWEMPVSSKEVETTDALIEGIVGGHKAFAISEGGKITKLF